MKTVFAVLSATVLAMTSLTAFAQAKRACTEADANTITLAMADMKARETKMAELMNEGFHSAPTLALKRQKIGDAISLGKANLAECKLAFAMIDVPNCSIPTTKKAFETFDSACTTASSTLHRIEIGQLLINFQQ